MMNLPQPSRWLLSTAPARTGERAIAIAVIGIAFIAFVATVPYVRVPLARVPAFIPAYQSALLFVDLITAVLLFSQFMWLRSSAILALAAGYLFDAAMIVPHTMSFPGVFAPTGLLNSGEQTTAWLYIFWHGGFPLFVLAYAWWRDYPVEIPAPYEKLAIVGAIAGVVVLVAGLTWLATGGHDQLPRVMQGGDYSMLVTKGISPMVWLLTLIALVAVWWRATTVLDLWLMVVMTVWLFDIALAAIFGSSRYDLGFYAGRLYGLIAASVVLIALLIEIMRLYGRLAGQLAQAEDQNLELIRSREALARRHRMEAIGQLTGGIAHDFNNLLTTIGGNLELIRKNAGDAARVERLADKAMNAARRGGKLTRQLLTFGGRQEMRPALVDVSRLIQEFEPVLNRAAEGTQLMTGLSAVVHPVQLDPVQFETALLNLIANAREATGNAGRIVIETRNVTVETAPMETGNDAKTGPHVLVTVRDTGPGMNAETAARVFEPFFTTKPPGLGSGLGLSQVYGFVRSAGGHLRLDTQPGRGTSVNMFFPKPDKPIAEAEANAEAPVETAASKIVLVVEDDEDVREVTAAAVADLGYQVREAASAEQALEVLRRDGAVDLLFSDIVMPGGMTGLELAAEARRIQPGLKVLLTSGNIGAVFARGSGGDFELIEKPYSHADLAAKLRSLVGGG